MKKIVFDFKLIMIYEGDNRYVNKYKVMQNVVINRNLCKYKYMYQICLRDNKGLNLFRIVIFKFVF